ncbi:hypothetical protein ACTPOK_40135 [Streptomyces inhibens]|uniref:hypothetical protein n=1 Tax=Streptomyces inhibens TaxID=2293571 RepID=UPI00402ACBCE
MARRRELIPFLPLLDATPARRQIDGNHLYGRIPVDFLAEIGWDEDRQALSMPMDHPLPGWRACKVMGCAMPTRGRTQLSLPCERKLAASVQDETALDGQRARYARQAISPRHARQAISQVAVPFGRCEEPRNVQAGGGACPLRRQCGGCDHFRSDASYLPELTAYPHELRRTKERVLAATGLDERAREKALPSEQEIARMKHVIARVEDDLDQLTVTERHELEEAITLVRRTSPPVRRR